VLNIPEIAQSEIEVQNVSLQVLKNTNREVMIESRIIIHYKIKKIINKEEFIPLNDNEKAKFETKKYRELSNEKISNEENLVFSKNNGNSKFKIKNE